MIGFSRRPSPPSIPFVSRNTIGAVSPATYWVPPERSTCAVFWKKEILGPLRSTIAQPGGNRTSSHVRLAAGQESPVYCLDTVAQISSDVVFRRLLAACALRCRGVGRTPAASARSFPSLDSTAGARTVH